MGIFPNYTIMSMSKLASVYTVGTYKVTQTPVQYGFIYCDSLLCRQCSVTLILDTEKSGGPNNKPNRGGVDQTPNPIFSPTQNFISSAFARHIRAASRAKNVIALSRATVQPLIQMADNMIDLRTLF